MLWFILASTLLGTGLYANYVLLEVKSPYSSIKRSSVVFQIFNHLNLEAVIN